MKLSIKKILFSVNPYVWLAFIISPFILVRFIPEINNETFLNITIRSIPSIIIAIWTILVIEYICYTLESNKFRLIIYTLLTVEIILHAIIIQILYSKNDFTLMDFRFLFPTVLTFRVLIAIFGTIKIKKLFFERSTWFLFLEILTPPFGILSLTPAIIDYEKNER